jgi:hypothetical protein
MNRRSFLGGVLAASLGGVGLLSRRAGVQSSRLARVPFYARGPESAGPTPSAGIPGNLAGRFGEPEFVELGKVEVGHFHDLMHEGDGRIAYLYEATIPGRGARRGFVKLGAAMGSV